METRRGLIGFNIRPAAASDFKRLCKLFEELDEFHRRGRPDLFVKPDGRRANSAKSKP